MTLDNEVINPLSLLEAQAKYGEIHNGVWGDESKFCTLLEIPAAIGSKWINSLTKNPVTHIYCNKDLVKPLSRALENIKDEGLVTELKTFDGCLMIRDVRAQPGTLSAHSYALAIDINAFENPLSHPSKFSPHFVECFKEAGFSWGGNFHRRLDTMHYSIGW